MNRRNFFGAVTAAVIAGLLPETRIPDTFRYHGAVTGRWSAKGPGHMLRYGSGLKTFKMYAYQRDALAQWVIGDLAKTEARVFQYYRSKDL